MISKEIQPLIEDREAIVSLVRQWGGANSDAALDPKCKFFTLPYVDGCISYRQENSFAIIYGDPICAEKNISVLTKSFHQFCSNQQLSVIYIAASESFKTWAMENVCKAFIAFGEELILDPHDDPQKRTGNHGSLVRRKVRHALHENLVIEEYLDMPNLSKEKEIEKIKIQWLNSRIGPQVHISNVFLFNDRSGKRWFYAKKDHELVAIVVLNQLQSFQGWLINHLMTTKNAPHGTPEALIIHVLDRLRQEGCHHTSFGVVGAAHLGEISGLGLISTGIARFVYTVSQKIFHLANRKTFWEKFHPQQKPSYLLFSHSNVGFKELWALKNALNVEF